MQNASGSLQFIILLLPFPGLFSSGLLTIFSRSCSVARRMSLPSKTRFDTRKLSISGTRRRITGGLDCPPPCRMMPQRIVPPMNAFHCPARLRIAGAVAFLSGLFASLTRAAEVTHYRLLHGSILIDDCPICGRPTVPEPMRGTFDLRVLESTPMGTRYSLENIHFTAGTTRTYTVQGEGSLEIGGEVAVTQKMDLEVDISDDSTRPPKPCELKTDPVPLSRAMPMMEVSVEQTNGTFTQVYSLTILAAPLRDLWFSTRDFFNRGVGPEEFILGGDLLSLTGRVIKRNSDLYGSIGATPPGPDLGLDAVHVLPGGEIAFSLDTGFPMTNVGPVHHGDLLSTAGRIVRRNEELLTAFNVPPPSTDAGLDGVQLLDSGEILFSIESDVFSGKLGTMLHRGDLLSSTGKVTRTQQQLLQKFHPPSSADFGLDAFYQWPGGEIWFSTEQGFTDSQLGPVTDGDLLSDDGSIVFNNNELLAAFGPPATSAGLGLDALFIVTDVTSPPAPPVLNLAVKPGTQTLHLSWQSTARVFQVERSTDLSESFEAISPVIPALSWDDEGALQNRPRAFYRLRQW
jgi:hypothetical protein